MALPLRVGFNARLLADRSRRGFNRYTAELVRALHATGAVQPVLFSAAPIHSAHDLDGVEAVIADVSPQWRWQHVWLPSALAKAGVEVFHAPAHWGVPWRSHCPVVATIHDLADREWPDPSARPGVRATLRHRLEESLVVHRCRRIITPSDWTAASVVRHLGVSRARIAVTVEGAAPAFVVRRDRQALPAGVSPGAYFLHVGGLEARKNPLMLVRALAKMPAEHRRPVIVVGGDVEAVNRLLATAGAEHVSPLLRWIGELPDAELAALYSGAIAVLQPSWVEGFGLPVVEALHAGTPAVVADRSALPEIVGDAGMTADPSRPDAWAAAMTALVTGPQLRADLSFRAARRAPRYTWDRAAEETLTVYREILGRI